MRLSPFDYFPTCRIHFPRRAQKAGNSIIIYKIAVPYIFIIFSILNFQALVFCLALVL